MKKMRSQVPEFYENQMTRPEVSPNSLKTASKQNKKTGDLLWWRSPVITINGTALAVWGLAEMFHPTLVGELPSHLCLLEGGLWEIPTMRGPSKGSP